MAGTLQTSNSKQKLSLSRLHRPDLPGTNCVAKVLLNMHDIGDSRVTWRTLLLTFGDSSATKWSDSRIVVPNCFVAASRRLAMLTLGDR